MELCYDTATQQEIAIIDKISLYCSLRDEKYNVNSEIHRKNSCQRVEDKEAVEPTAIASCQNITVPYFYPCIGKLF